MGTSLNLRRTGGATTLIAPVIVLCLALAGSLAPLYAQAVSEGSEPATSSSASEGSAAPATPEESATSEPPTVPDEATDRLAAAPTDCEAAAAAQAALEPPLAAASAALPGAAALPLAAAAADEEGEWTPVKSTSGATLAVKGGKQASSTTAGDGDWYYDSTYSRLHILTSTKMTLRTVTSSTDFTPSDTAVAQRIEIRAGVKAQLTFDGVRLETVNIPLNMVTNVKGTANGTTATKGSQIVDQTQLYLTLAPYSQNVLKNTARRAVKDDGRPAIRCGEGSTIVIDDAVRNLDANGNIVTPEGGVVPYDVTLENGTKLKAGDPLSAMQPSGEDIDGVPAIGSLELYGGNFSAALGGSFKESSGTIIINGGRITAEAAAPVDSDDCWAGTKNTSTAYTGHSVYGGAAIGGGAMGSGTRTVVNGGEVFAYASLHGAGIGAGMGFWEESGYGYTPLSDALNGEKRTVVKTVSGSKRTYWHTVGGDIYINGGYTEAHGGGHGNAIGGSCSRSPNETSNTNHIIKVTGGTIITSTAKAWTSGKKKGCNASESVYDIGGEGGHVLVTGGSVKVGGTSKFQGYDGGGGIAYNTHDVDTWADIQKNHPDTAMLLPSSDEVFMVTANLKNNIDNMTDEEVVAFQLTINGEVYPYGLPARFDDGKLYFWLPKWAVTGKDGVPGPYQVDIDMAVMRDGNVQTIDTLYIPEPSLTNQSKNLVKRYRDFTIPDDYPIAKVYDGLPYNPLTISASKPLVYVRDDGGTEPLTNVAKAKFKYRLHDGEGEPAGDWFQVSPTASGDTGLPTDVCSFDVEIVSTQYADNAEYRDSYWGHRAFGTGAIVKAPADIVELRAAWVDAEGNVLSGLHGDVLRARAHHLRVYADVTSGLFDESDVAYGQTAGEPSANTCKSPEGTLSFTLDGETVASVDLSAATATLDATEPAKTSTEAGLVSSKSAWREESFDGTRRHTQVTYDIPRNAVYAVLEADEADSAHILSVGFSNGTNFRDTSYTGQPEVALTTDGLHEPSSDEYTLTVTAEPEDAVTAGCWVLAGGGTAGASSSGTYAWGDEATASVSPKEAAGWKVKSIQVDGDETYLGEGESLFTAEKLAALTSASLSMEGRDFTVSRPGVPTGYFAVTFPDMRRDHTVRAVFERATFAATASVRDGVGGTALVTAVNGEALESPGASRTVEFGDDATFSWQAQEGWRTADVLVDGKSLAGTKGFALADAGSWTVKDVRAATAFEVVYERYTYPVTVKATPTLGGTAQVSAVNGTALVTPVASYTATHGDAVEVAYAPAEGFHVKSISVASGGGAPVPWPVESYPTSLVLPSVDGAREVAVAFERNTYPVTLTVSDGDGAEISGPATVAHGQSGEVAWKAKEGYEVTAVTVNGEAHDPVEYGSAASGKLTLANVTGPQAVHVVVALKIYQVSARVAAGNGAVAVAGPDGADAGTAATVRHGEAAAVTWAPAAGWEVERVTVGGRELSATEAAAGRWDFASVTASTEVTVSFKRTTFRIDTYADRTLGTLTASAAVPFGDDFPVSWSPNGGVYIEDIAIDADTPAESVHTDEEFLRSGSYRFASVAAGHTFAVNFKKFDDPLVVVTASGNGTAGLAAGSGPLFSHGESATVEWAASTGHEVKGVSLTVVSARPGEEESVVSGPTWLTAEELAAGSLAIDNLQGGYRYMVAVSFEPQTFAIETSASPAEGGTITPAFEEVYGRDARVSFAPAEGWRVKGVTVDGRALEGEGLAEAVQGHVQFEAIARDHTVSVDFERIPLVASIAAEPAEGGSVSLDADGVAAGVTSATFLYGGSVGFSWQPNPGWQVTSVTVNGKEEAGLAGQTSHTVQKLTADTALSVAFERLSFPVTAQMVDSTGSPVAAAIGSVSAPTSPVFWGEDASAGWTLATGWEIDSVIVDGQTLAGEALSAAVAAGKIDLSSVTEAHSVRVVVKQAFVNVTATATPAQGGTVTASGTVTKGSPAQVTWKAAEGWHVAAVNVNGVADASALAAGTYVVGAAEHDTSVEVVFERDGVPLTYEVSDGAGATLTGPATVPWGDGATATWEVMRGWHVERLLVGGIERPVMPLQTSVTLASVTAPTTVRLEVARDVLSVKTGISAGGAITEGRIVAFGADFTVAWTVDEGFRVASITVDGTALAGEELSRAIERCSWTFAAVGQAHSLFVELIRVQCAVDVAAVPAEGGTVRGPKLVWWGDDAQVSWQPREGWHADAVTVNGTPVDEADVRAGAVTLTHVTADAAVRVVFERDSYALAARVRGNVGGSAAVTDDGGAPATSVLHGDPFRFSWAADTGYRCADILVNGESVRSTGLFAVSDAGNWRCAAAEGAASFEVAYEKLTYPVSVKAEPAAGGTAEVRLSGAEDGASSVDVEHGGTAEVSYKAAEGWELTAVTVNGESWPVASYPTGLALTDVAEAMEVEASFAKKTYPLTLTVSDEAGASIAGPARVAHGEDAEVRWETKAGYRVIGVTVDGQALAPDAFGEEGGTYRFASVISAHSVHVAVEKRTYDVSAMVVEGNGTVSVAGPESEGAQVSVAHGDAATMRWDPARGWKVKAVTVDGLPLSAEAAARGSHEFANVTAPHRVEVSFERKTYLVETYADVSLGTITSSAQVPFGDDFEVAWSPHASAFVAGAEVDGAALDVAAVEAGRYLFQKVGAGHKVAVEFKPIPGKALVALETAGGGEAHLVGDGDGSFDPGENAQVGWSAQEGWSLARATLTVTDADGVITSRALTAEELASGTTDGFALSDLQENYVYRLSLVFEPLEFTVSATKEGEGTVGAAVREQWGKTARMSFAPAEGHRVQAVTVDGTALGGAALAAAVADGSVEFTDLRANHVVHVAFEPILCVLSIAGSPAAGGTVTLDGAPAADGACSSTVAWGSPAQFGWRPAEGWRVKNVTVNGEDRPGLAAGASELACGKATEDVAVKVSFERIPLRVTATLSDPAAGTVSVPGTVLWGDAATVSWTLNEGWHVGRVLVNGGERPDLLAADGTIFAKVIEDAEVRVEVARDEVQVTTSLDAPEGVQASITPSATVLWGDGHTVSWTIPAGYLAAEVRVNGERRTDLEGPSAPCEIAFADIHVDVTVDVVVEKAPETFALDVLKTGSVSERNTLAVSEGDTVTVLWPTEETQMLRAMAHDVPLVRAGSGVRGDAEAAELGHALRAQGGAAATALAQDGRTYVVTMPGAGHVLVSVKVDGGEADVKEAGAYVFAEMDGARQIDFHFEKAQDKPTPPTPIVPDDPGDNPVDPGPDNPDNPVDPGNPGTDPTPDYPGDNPVPAAPADPATPQDPPTDDEPATREPVPDDGAAPVRTAHPGTIVRLAQTGDPAPSTALAALALAALGLLGVAAARSRCRA